MRVSEKPLVNLSLEFSLFAFISVTMLALIVPLLPPFFPNFVGLESWVVGINEAVTQRMVLGRDIIYTYGPYATISTRFYHPGTDALALIGSVFLASAFCLALYRLSGVFSKLPVLAIVFLLLILRVQDFLFLFYPILSAAYVISLNVRTPSRMPWKILEMSIILGALGLLPLIKGSFLLSALFVLLPLILVFWQQRRYEHLLISILAPLVSLIVFWKLSGQALSYLPAFFYSIFAIISGYTEAMALDLGSLSEVLLYLTNACLLVGAWWFRNNYPWTIKWLFLIVLLGFLFIAFKAGFVRQDEHVFIALQSLLGAALIIWMLQPSLITRMLAGLTLLCLAWVSSTHNATSWFTTASTLKNEIKATYSEAWLGLQLRLTHPETFTQRYQLNLQEIVKTYKLPKVAGTVDIFSYNQMEVLATHSQWQPRPVFQSYSAYTKTLAQLNAQFFRTPPAPEHVIFKLQPIDYHLPSLEDGAAWLALSDNYYPETLLQDGVLLKRKPELQAHANTTEILNSQQHLGEIVQVPLSDQPIYLEVNIKPTLLGKLIALVYKPAQLRMHLSLVDGETKQFRVIANMMQSPFLLSPLVDNIRSFTFVNAGQQQIIEHLRVQNFMIESLDKYAIFWQKEYTLTLNQYQKPKTEALPNNIFNTFNKLPNNIKLLNAGHCDANFDLFYGFNPTIHIQNSLGVLGVHGWLAKSVSSGIGVEDIFLVLDNPKGTSYYVRAQRSPREDVKMLFKQPNMKDLGFDIDANYGSLKGDYTVKFALSHSGSFYLCDNLAYPVTFLP